MFFLKKTVSLLSMWIFNVLLYSNREALAFYSNCSPLLIYLPSKIILYNQIINLHKL